MKRWFIVFMVALSMVILLSPCTPQAASPTASTTKAAKQLRLHNLKPAAFLKL